MTSRTEKYYEAVATIPDDLVPVFDELVDQYKFSSLKVTGKSFVSYMVIAELVLSGWRPSDDIREGKK